MDPEGFKCANCSSYLLDTAFQLVCGDRICGGCVKSLKYKARNSGCITKNCPRCGEEITLDRLNRDKAVERELETATIKCTNQNCSWKGFGQCYKEHIVSCKFTKIPCPNKCHGCIRQLLKSQLSQHLSQGCQFTIVECHWCSKEIYKKDVAKHMHNECTQMRHNFKDTECGLKPVNRATRDLEPSTKTNRVMDQQVVLLQNEVAQLLSKVTTKLQHLTNAVARTEASIQQFQEGFEKMAVIVQTLQATSYNGTFIWKIPDVQRRRAEARSGRTVSLYSAPFYTSRHGYKMCLRLYMDGDGSGKGTHLSLFLALMHGEYDALLTWPFKQIVTLILLDQDKQNDIFQSFRPNPSSSSFQRPINDMNIASGCPQFVPLSILDSPSYVRDDTMYLKADTTHLGVCCFSQPEPLSAF